MTIGALATRMAGRAVCAVARFAVGVDGVIEADVEPVVGKMTGLALPRPVAAGCRMAALAGVDDPVMGEDRLRPLFGVVAEGALVAVMAAAGRFMAGFTVGGDGAVIEDDFRLPVFGVVTGGAGAVVMVIRCRVTSVTDVGQG